MSDDESGSRDNNPETEPTLDGQRIKKEADDTNSIQNSDSE